MKRNETNLADPGHREGRQQRKLLPTGIKACQVPEPLHNCTVREARETYIRIESDSFHSDSRTSKYQRQKETYARLLEADRRLRDKYDGLTTVMLTRRLSPLDENDEWLTPWECDNLLHGGKVHRSVRETLAYQLDNFAYEWAAVTAPTESAGTPHEHIYLWIEDADDEVDTSYIEPALKKHLKHCPNAYEKHHKYRTDGSKGAITYQHQPERTPNEQTTGAQYLASQLAHVATGDLHDPNKDDPLDTLVEGAALSWASPCNWFRASRGI